MNFVLKGLNKSGINRRFHCFIGLGAFSTNLSINTDYSSLFVSAKPQGGVAA